MQYVPFNYEKINLIQGTYVPSQQKLRNNQAFRYWERSLFQRALSAIEIKIPDEWTEAVDFFNYCLYGNGFVAVFNSDDYGITFQPAKLTGIDWYYRPTTAVISNPALKAGLNLKIGEKCEILKLTPDYSGIFDVISYYAEELALLKNAINMSLINNKYAFMLGAKNKAAGEALKKMLDKINDGEPAVIFDQKIQDDPQTKTEPWQFWNRGNLKESYLTTDQLADFRTILHNFDSEIGIPTMPIEKKERMITDEVGSTERDAKSRAQIWIDTLNSSAKAVNKMFGLNISASFRYEEEEVTQDADEADDAGNV